MLKRILQVWKIRLVLVFISTSILTTAKSNACEKQNWEKKSEGEDDKSVVCEGIAVADKDNDWSVSGCKRHIDTCDERDGSY